MVTWGAASLHAWIDSKSRSLPPGCTIPAIPWRIHNIHTVPEGEKCVRYHDRSDQTSLILPGNFIQLFLFRRRAFSFNNFLLQNFISNSVSVKTKLIGIFCISLVYSNLRNSNPVLLSRADSHRYSVTHVYYRIGGYPCSTAQPKIISLYSASVGVRAI